MHTHRDYKKECSFVAGALLQELGSKTKLIEPRFGVVFHRTSTEGISMSDHKAVCIETMADETIP